MRHAVNGRPRSSENDSTAKAILEQGEVGYVGCSRHNFGKLAI